MSSGPPAAPADLSPSPSRRTVVGGLGVALAAGLVPGTQPRAQTGLDLDRFLDLSSSLTGAPLDALDRDAAASLLAAFQAAGRARDLVTLAADPAGDPALATELVAAWYSGLYDTRAGTAVATYNGALVWRALAFTKPLGNCGGETGYWSQPPGT
ncbi:MAG: sugar dehydrogenase complex small subunit [Alsobacter sp.]